MADTTHGLAARLRATRPISFIAEDHRFVLVTYNFLRTLTAE